MSAAAHDRARALNEAVSRLKQREQELRRSRAAVVRTLAHAVEYRDPATGAHVDRMSSYCALLAKHLGSTRAHCELIGLASQLHDVGKIAIPDAILSKPAALDVDERRVMETHAELGYELLQDSEEPLLQMAALIARTHHERYDGSGYPRGLQGDAIPFEGRIAAVADVFDALTSDRPYRRRLELADALVLMQAGRGTQFDREVADALFANLDEAIQVGHLSRPAGSVA